MYRVWVLWATSRPLQVLGVLAVALNGVIIAYARENVFDLTATIAMFLSLLLVTISIHQANEYADVETDALTQRTAFSGGSTALVRYPDMKQVVLLSMIATFIAGFVIAILGGLSMQTLVILVIGGLLGWAYSLPPLKLAWNGWGEITNAFIGAMLLTAYGYVALVGRVDAFILLATIPFVTADFTNLLATHYADKEADAAVGKNTLATLYDHKLLVRVYAVVATVTFATWLALTPTILPFEMLLFFIPVLILTILGWRDYRVEGAPHMSVYAMIAMLAAQTLGWGLVAFTPIWS